jgi:hypothetical protein
MLTLFLESALIFAGLLLLLRRRAQLGVAVIVANGAVALFFGLSADGLAIRAVSPLAARPRVDLALVTLLVVLLEGILRESRGMLLPAHPCPGLTVQCFRASFGPVRRLAFAPQAALVGLATAGQPLIPLGG